MVARGTCSLRGRQKEEVSCSLKVIMLESESLNMGNGGDNQWLVRKITFMRRPTRVCSFGIS